MTKKSNPKPYNSGTWTVARFHSFIKSALRAASRRWPPKFEALKKACVGKRLDSATGKQSFRYKCAGCANIFKAVDVSVDHIYPVVDPERGFTTWDDVIDRMFCEVDKLQVLCNTCHSIKTANERKQRTKKGIDE
jgi:5-methylcytosine-specific restriction endonuclease McrA